jgi:protein O-GlcNAc transferase
MDADVSLDTRPVRESAGNRAERALAKAAQLLGQATRAGARVRGRRLLRETCRAYPDRAELWDALGFAHVADAAWEAALGAFAEAGRLAPRSLTYALHRVDAASCAGSGEPELARLDLASALDPLDIVPLAARGVLLAALGREEEAIDTLTAASLLAPENAEIHALLGTRLVQAGRLGEADAALRQAIALGNTQPDLRNTLGAVLMRRYRHAEAYEELAALIAEQGPSVVPMCNLASAATSIGRHEESEALLREAAALAPDAELPWRTLCNTLPYRDGIGGAELLAAARAYAQRLPRGEPPEDGGAFTTPPDPDRRLRVGLLSGSLRIHPVGWLTVAGFEMLGRADFVLIGLAGCRADDVIARRFRAACEEWHEVGRMNDAVLASEIRRLAIDIVIDLGGFGDSGRMTALAHRAAPVQVKWVGTQNHSTGLPEIDWLITDRWETPEGNESLYSERLLRMPDGYVCYSPPPYAPDVGPLPALATGSVTFGCLNNLAKITQNVIATWARILTRVPGSRLLLKTHQFAEAPVVETVSADFARHGIAADRIIFAGVSPHRAFLAEYNRVDLQLDPFPYTGGLTTCEALWMGVPTVTLPADTFSSRHSLSHLSNVGLGDWAAGDLAEYEALAVTKASDLAALARLRAGLRARVAASPLCDAPRFGRNLGAALRFAWQEWCRSVGPMPSCTDSSFGNGSRLALSRSAVCCAEPGNSP